MPRHARVKSLDSVYHIMVRSISDTPLYKSGEDKHFYLKLIRKYQKTFLFKVYAYCIMDTHAHILIDSCGSDISRIMHGINQCYAQYFNRIYKRHGHLFQDRFKSNIISDDRGLINASAYINKNPKDIVGYEGREEEYFYSSFAVYTGLRKDEYGILDKYFILNLFSRDTILAKRQYVEYVRKYDDKKDSGEMEYANEQAEYRSERTILVRDLNPCDVINFVSSYIKQDKTNIHVKYVKGAIDMKALSAFLMLGLCNMKQKDICREMGNITQSHASKLCAMGLRLIDEKENCRNIIGDFLSKRVS